VIHTTDAPVLTAPAAIDRRHRIRAGLQPGIADLCRERSRSRTPAVGSVSGPFQILFIGLTANVTLVNATGTNSGTPYITVSAPASLAPGQSVVVNVQFKDPSNATIHFTPQVQEGSI
jgi:hypothetical protein